MSVTRIVPAPTGRSSGRQSSAITTRSATTATCRVMRGDDTALGRRGENAVADAVLELLPERNDLARVEDRRVGARDDADEQGEREAANRIPAEQEQRKQRQHDGEGRDDRPCQRRDDRV